MSKLDDGIPFGQTFTYLWNITANFAPGKDDDNCVPWGYHSHVDSMSDIESGLVGLLVICNQGDHIYYSNLINWIPKGPFSFSIVSVSTMILNVSKFQNNSYYSQNSIHSKYRKISKLYLIYGLLQSFFSRVCYLIIR